MRSITGWGEEVSVARYGMAIRDFCLHFVYIFRFFLSQTVYPFCSSTTKPIWHVCESRRLSGSCFAHLENVGKARAGKRLVHPQDNLAPITKQNHGYTVYTTVPQITELAPVVQRADNCTQGITRYPVDKMYQFQYILSTG